MCERLQQDIRTAESEKLSHSGPSGTNLLNQLRVLNESMDPNPYAYVFGDGLPMPPLTKLDDTRDLSVVYTMYWGVSIDQDECEWVGVHGQPHGE